MAAALGYIYNSGDLLEANKSFQPNSQADNCAAAYIITLNHSVSYGYARFTFLLESHGAVLATGKGAHRAYAATAIALDEVVDFLEHNELGITGDWLRPIAEEADWESVEILKLLALAEASMGRSGKQQVLDQRLTQLIGHAHETKLPAA